MRVATYGSAWPLRSPSPCAGCGCAPPPWAAPASTGFGTPRTQSGPITTRSNAPWRTISLN
jgi:hypothetical protein